MHRRIQDFVGGAKAPPGSAPDYCAAVNCLGGEIFLWGRGGQGPLAPPWIRACYVPSYCKYGNFLTLYQGCYETVYETTRLVYETPCLRNVWHDSGLGPYCRTSVSDGDASVASFSLVMPLSRVSEFQESTASVAPTMAMAWVNAKPYHGCV